MSTPDMREMVRLAKLGRKAEQRSEAVRGCFGALFAWVGTVFVRAWMLMLGVGVIHGSWWPGMRTVGFWPAVRIVLLLNWLAPNHVPAKKAGAS